MVVGFGSRKIGMIVDYLEGKQEIVIKSLEQNYKTVEGLAGARVVGATEVEIGPAAARWVPLAVQVPHDSARAAGAGAHRIEFVIEQQGAPRRRIREDSTFIVPR